MKGNYIMLEFYTKVVGVTFEGRQRNIRYTSVGDRLTLARDKNNPFDCNAIKVFNSAGADLGFISKELAEKMAPQMDMGVIYTATVTSITGTNPGENMGVNILVKQL